MNKNRQLTVGLLNDSFPPVLDGVANAVVNYAQSLWKLGEKPIVITPSHKKADDSSFEYPVYRYPSVDFSKLEGNVAGIPFSPKLIKRLRDSDIDILHSHCPIISNFVARELRQIKKAPIILTYHTKFDIDIQNIIKSKFVQKTSIKALVSNIRAADEIWVVSRGAGENLRSLGYEGDYIVMPNGVDMPKEKVSATCVEDLRKEYNLTDEVPVFLFVGRLMWYKGIRIIVDALEKLKASGVTFKMVFIGSGNDRTEIEKYVADCCLSDSCIFTGAIHDRTLLRTWYSLADLFLFPSTFDTNGLVVREAAANDLASVLIKGSCAAEDVTDGQNAFLVDENADAMHRCLLDLCKNKEKIYEVGIRARKELYIHWNDSVKNALERYHIVSEKYKCGEYPKVRTPMEVLMKTNAALMKAFSNIGK